jgi:hypothetical protein
MEITKEQTQFIDSYLKKKGIKYWDLRIEMIDHIITLMELDSETNNFEKEFINTLKKLGWQGSLYQINREGWQNVNIKYRRDYHKGFVNFFKKLNNILIFVVSLFTLYIVSEMISFKSFKNLSFILFSSPLIIVFIEFIKSLFKKYGRSVNLDYGVTYMIMSFLILNMFPTLFKSESEIIQKTMWFLILPIHSVAFYSGYKLYKKAIFKVENMRKQIL